MGVLWFAFFMLVGYDHGTMKTTTKMNSRFKFFGVVAALAVVLTGCTAGNPTDPNAATGGASAFEDDGCIHITIATSSEKVNLMDELAAKFKDSPEAKSVDQCITVKPINLSSGVGSDLFALDPKEYPLDDKEYWPTLWSPASTIWTNRVSAAGSNAVNTTNAKSFTQTPVVMAIPESMAKQLDYPNTPISLTDIHDLIVNPEGWGSVGKPIWGSFKISKTNPNTSTTGLEIILMQAYEAAGKTADLTEADIEGAKEFSREFESGAIHYGDTTGKVLTTLYEETQNGASGSGYVSAIAVEETSLINYNLGNPDSHTVKPGEVLTPPKEKLVAVYPEGGSVWSDNPVTVLNSPWVTADKKAAGDAFAAFLQTKTAQESLPSYGFRPLDESVPLGDLFTKQNGIDPAQPAISLPQPDASVVSAAKDQWTEIRKPSAVLELVDISKSMNEGSGINNESKLDGAVAGVQTTIDHFRSTDEVGVWAFTSDIDNPSKYDKNVIVVREFSPLGSDAENLKDDIKDLYKADKGGTPLYDSILASYKYMQDNAEEGRINAIIVLTDGEDAGSSTSLETLLIKINSTSGESSDGAQVRVFPIAYGAGADLTTLELIAKASGGQVFDATDPTQLESIFKQVINNF